MTKMRVLPLIILLIVASTANPALAAGGGGMEALARELAAPLGHPVQPPAAEQ